jgi:hypothetical protein
VAGSNSKWFDKLKEIFNFNLSNISISNLVNINLSINIRKDSGPGPSYAVNPLTESVDLYPHRLDAAKQADFLKSLPDAVDQDEIALVDREARARLENLSQSDKDNKDILHFFKPILPGDDFAALRSSFLVGQLWERRAPRHAAIKSDIIDRYGDRGRNICNLATAGYFHSVIKPLYEAMHKTSGFKLADFHDHYNIIIEQSAFAVFVSGAMSAAVIIDEVKAKVRRNSKFGIKYVSIHGIGKETVKNIRTAVAAIKAEGFVFTESEGARVGKASLFLRLNIKEIPKA